MFHQMLSPMFTNNTHASSNAITYFHKQHCCFIKCYLLCPQTTHMFHQILSPMFTNNTHVSSNAITYVQKQHSCYIKCYHLCSHPEVLVCLDGLLQPVSTASGHLEHPQTQSSLRKQERQTSVCWIYSSGIWNWKRIQDQA